VGALAVLGAELCCAHNGLAPTPAKKSSSGVRAKARESFTGKHRPNREVCHGVKP